MSQKAVIKAMNQEPLQAAMNERQIIKELHPAKGRSQEACDLHNKLVKARHLQLDEIIDRLQNGGNATVTKTMKTAVRQSPAAIIKTLQANMDLLADASNITRVVIPVNKADLPKVQNGPKSLVQLIKLDKVTKRNTAGRDPLGEENLGTLSARATGNVAKAEDDIDLNLDTGFASRGSMTGEYNK